MFDWLVQSLSYTILDGRLAESRMGRHNSPQAGCPLSHFTFRVLQVSHDTLGRFRFEDVPL